MKLLSRRSEKEQRARPPHILLIFSESAVMHTVRFVGSFELSNASAIVWKFVSLEWSLSAIGICLSVNGS